VAFPTARLAVRAAIGLMQALEAYNQSSPPHPIQAGVGIDVGEPAYADGDFIGNTLNKASRLTSRAAAGQILVTPVVRELVGMTLDVRYERLELKDLRGLEETIQTYEVLWQNQ